MRKWVVVLIILLIAAGASVFAWMSGIWPGTNDTGNVTAQGLTTTATTKAPVPVEILQITQDHLTHSISLNGNIKPRRKVTVVSKVSGKVTYAGPDLGEAVTDGEILVKLDDTELKLGVKQREAALAAVRAALAKLEAGAAAEELEQAESGLEQARTNADRAHELLNRNEKLLAEGVISQDTFEAVRTQYEIAKLQEMSAESRLAQLRQGARSEDVDAAKAQVAQAEAALDLERRRLDDATVTAPFDGLVAQTLPTEGAMVGSGSAVTTIVDVDRVNAEVGVTDRYVSRLAPGQQVEVVAEALGSKTWRGEIEAISPVADSQTRNYLVRVGIPNEDRILRAGMMVDVHMSVLKTPDGPVVPRKALTSQNGSTFAYVVDRSQSSPRVERRSVTVSEEVDGSVLVAQGLAVGDWVVVTGQDGLHDGSTVDIVREVQ